MPKTESKPAKSRTKKEKPPGVGSRSRAQKKDESADVGALSQAPLLVAKSAGLYRRARLKEGRAVVSGVVKSVQVHEFPILADMLGLIFVIDLHAPGKTDADYSMRIKLGPSLIYESVPVPMRAARHSRKKDFPLIQPLRGFSFPEPGIYLLNFIYNGVVIYLAALELTTPKTKAIRYRH